MSTPSQIVQLRDVKMQFEDKKVLEGVSLDVQPQERLVIMGQSGSGTSAETVDVPDPAPGVYLVVVHGWQTDGPDSNYTLFSWAFGPDQGNLTVTAPPMAVLGAAGTIGLSYGLPAPGRYLGAVRHAIGGSFVGRTLVSINAN